MTSRIRLETEARELAEENSDCFSVSPRDDDIYSWTAILMGPKGTPYEGGKFVLKLDFGDKYPILAPAIKFVTPILHSNIALDGSICLDILKDKWSPVLTISQVLLSISSLLNEPNPRDPLNTKIADLYLQDQAKHDEAVAGHTRKYAISGAVKADKQRDGV